MSASSLSREEWETLQVGQNSMYNWNGNYGIIRSYLGICEVETFLGEV